MRPVTHKLLQIHFECVCGLNEVDHDRLPIRWKDFSKAGIVRKVDKSTGKPFLLQRLKANECHCDDNY